MVDNSGLKQENTTTLIESLQNLGKEITLNRVLLVNNEGEILVGKPYLDSVKIKGKILEHLRGRKKIVYKMRPKKKTRKKQGHRQELTRVLIEDISIN